MSGSTSNHHFLKCYQDLLARLRDNGSDFARQNPEIAPYLDMSNRKSADPEIERLLESFAYLLAQVEHKSTLAQSEYLLQFIENIIPEITQPIPNLVIAQMNIDPTLAAKNGSTTQTLERFTQFRLNNELNEVFYFSNLYERKLTYLKIDTAVLVQAGATKENLYNNNKAIILKCSTPIPLNLKKQKKTKFAVHINADFNQSVLILDAIFASKKDFIVVVDNKDYIVPRSEIKANFNFESYSQKNNNSNCLYPLFDACHYHSKYFSFVIKIPSHIAIKNNVNIVIPVEHNTTYKIDVKNNSFLTNCIPLFDYYQKNITPIKTSEDVYEYNIYSDFYKTRGNEIVNINEVSTIEPVHNKIVSIKHFHERSLFNLKDPSIHPNCYWVAKRSFYADTEAQGRLVLKLILTESKTSDLSLPQYLYINAHCTNGKDTSMIQPGTKLITENNGSFFTAQTINWIEETTNITNIFEKIDTLNFLFALNQKILTNSFDNIEDILKAFEILSSTENPMHVLLNRVISNCKTIIKKENNTMQIWNGNVFHVPGVFFVFVFSNTQNIPFGFFFILNFLNSYFDHVKSINYSIQFDYTVEK